MISIKDNVDEVLRGIDRFSSQAPFAIALALTQTANQLKAELVAEQARVFDRPTRYTQNALWVNKATKQRLVAEVLLKDRLLSKTTRSAADVLGHHYTGGKRRQKALEYYAVRAGLISTSEYLVPGDYARLDSYGNMSRGQVQQIMSQLKLGLDPASWASKSARSKRAVQRAGVMFWSYGKLRGSHLARGVWMRDGNGVVPIMMVARATAYPQRIKLRAIGDRVFAARFKANLQRAWDRARATAR